MKKFKDTLCLAEKVGCIIYHAEWNCSEYEGEDFFSYKEKEIDWDWFKEPKSDWENGLHNGDCICAPSTCTACMWGSILEVPNSLLPFLIEPYGSDQKTALKRWLAHYFFRDLPKLKSNRVEELVFEDKDAPFIDKMFDHVYGLLKEEGFINLKLEMHYNLS